MTTKEILEQARDAKVYINSADTAVKNKALACMADKLTESADKILAANQEDMEQAKGKISDVMLDRLLLGVLKAEQLRAGIGHGRGGNGGILLLVDLQLADGNAVQYAFTGAYLHIFSSFLRRILLPGQGPAALLQKSPRRSPRGLRV